MAWKNKVEILHDAAVGATESFSRHLNLGGESLVAMVVVYVDWDGTTDDIDVNFYADAHDKTQAVSATVAAGGSGYSEGTPINVTGTMHWSSAQFLITGVSGGAVTTVTLADGGDLSWVPANPVTTSGIGSGCTLNVTWKGNEFDTEPFTTDTLTAAATPTRKTYIVQDYRRFIVSVTGGGTDSHEVYVYGAQYGKGL